MLKKNIIILENNLYLKMGLVKILENDYNIYSDINLSKNLYALMSQYKPDIIVINKLSKNNLEDVKRIRSEYPTTYVAILTSIILEEEMHEALLAGVSGFILYNIKLIDLTKAIDLISKGEYYFDSSTMTTFINISKQSIKMNINKIYNKLSVKTRLQAIEKAIKNRWIPYNLAISNLHVMNYNQK